MASEVDICNLALGQLGSHLITSFTDPTTEAQLCNINYPLVRDACLEDRDWSFALVERRLVAVTPYDTTLYPPEFSNAYQIPTDCLLIRYCFTPMASGFPTAGSSGNLQYINATSEQMVTRPTWNRYQDKAFSNTQQLWARYIQRQEDPSKFTFNFIQALACRLAAELAMPLVNKMELAAQKFKEYEIKITEASGRDGSQGTPQVVQVSKLTLTRY